MKKTVLDCALKWHAGFELRPIFAIDPADSKNASKVVQINNLIRMDSIYGRHFTRESYKVLLQLNISF